jgi:hypothetical protein
LSNNIDKWSDEYLEKFDQEIEKKEKLKIPNYDLYIPPADKNKYSTERPKKTFNTFTPKANLNAKFTTDVFKNAQSNTYSEIKKLQSLMGFDCTLGSYTNFNEKTKKYTKLNKKITQQLILEHFTHQRTVVLSQHPHTKMTLIDIDQRNNKKYNATDIVDKINEILVKDKDNSMIVEYSKSSGGYHLYIKFKEYVTDDCKRYIQKYFKENFDYEIEVKKGKELLKLPYSKQYDRCGYYNTEFPKHIYPMVYSHTEIENLVYTFENLEEVSLPTLFKKENKYGHKVNNYKNGVERTIDRYFNNDKIKEWYGYGAGTRYYAQLALAKYCYSYGMTFSEFDSLCDFCNDGSSKDMAKSKKVRDYKVKEAWKYGTGRLNPIIQEEKRQSKPTNYIYQDYVIPNKELEKVEYILKNAIKMNRFAKYEKNKKRILHDSQIIFEEMYKRLKYNQEHDIKYIDKEMKGLEKGVAFGNDLFKTIHKEFSLNTDILLIKKLLKESGLITLLKNDFGYSYSYKALRYVKHWLLNSIDSLYKFYLSLYSIKSPINILINNINIFSQYALIKQLNYALEFLYRDYRLIET